MEITMITAVICGGAFALLCYRRGLREGRALTEGMKVFPNERQEEIDPEIARMQSILQNINAYNGTGENQNEVEL